MVEKIKKCTKCGKFMIRRSTDGKFPLREDSLWLFWCGCGNIEDGNYIRDLTMEELYRKQWEETQEKDLLEVNL